ncbi:putative catalase [Dioscorea sansibarensis]
MMLLYVNCFLLSMTLLDMLWSSRYHLPFLMGSVRRQECFVSRWVDALMTRELVTHKLCNIWISYWSQCDKSLNEKVANQVSMKPIM